MELDEKIVNIKKEMDQKKFKLKKQNRGFFKFLKHSK